MTLKELITALESLPSSLLNREVRVWTKGGSLSIQDVRAEGKGERRFVVVETQQAPPGNRA